VKLSDFDYRLPEELIAQKPVEPRDKSRLMVINRKNGEIHHTIFRNITAYLKKGDLLVFNMTKVIPARLHLRKSTGARIELLLLEELDSKIWKCMVRPGNKVKVGTTMYGKDFSCECIERHADGTRTIRFDHDVAEILQENGEIPLPPYIHRKVDPVRYQTVYAKVPGAVAAPTAGLHFTRELLRKIDEMGVERAEVVLHVGVGTFRPIRAENVEDHRMHEEYYEIDTENTEKIFKARETGKRIIAVGTTVVRVLETIARQPRKKHYKGRTSLFIYPPFEFKLTDALITNFHLPKSSLLVLVSAFAGRELVMEAYSEAIEKRYRFFSFGDACFFI